MSKVQTNLDRYTIKATDTVESIAIHRKGEKFNKLWIWPASGLTEINGRNGSKGYKLDQSNSTTVYLGEGGDGPDICADPLERTDLPIKIELPPGEEKLLENVLIAGTQGDGIVFKWWPAWPDSEASKSPAP